MAKERADPPLRPESGRTVAIIVALGLVLGLACLGSLAALGFSTYHLATASPVIGQFGRISFSIEVTDNPDCTPLIVGCLIVPPPHGPNYLSVWGAITTYNSSGLETTAHSLLKVPVP